MRVRRAVVLDALGALAGGVLLAAALVWAEPGTASAATPTPVSARSITADRDQGGPVPQCTLADRRLVETSGMIWTPDGIDVVADSGNPSTVYRLRDPGDGGPCSVVGSRDVPVPGRDVEDLARSPDGTLWLADVGDNHRDRTTVAMIRLSPNGGESITRLAYPDGPHDAESLVVPADARPVIVTKDLGGHSGVYTTGTPLPPASATPGPVVPLLRVGTVVVPPSDSVGGPPLGGSLFTGGALSDDGRVVALRTYTDAWLYRVDGPGADGVVAAISRAPVRVPLPGEPQGEAVAFAPDGTLFAAGERGTSVTPAALRAVPNAAAQAEAAGTTAPPTSATSTGTEPAPRPEPGSTGVPVAATATVIGVLVLAGLVAAVVVLRRRARRASR